MFVVRFFDFFNRDYYFFKEFFMKRFLWILALAVFLSACGNEAKEAPDEAKEAGQVSEENSKDDEKASDVDKDVDKKDEEAEDQASLTEDDYFFSAFNLVTIKDGEILNVIKDVKKLGDDTYAHPVPLSDDVFLFGINGENTSTLMKINGKDFKEIYKIEGQGFSPSAMVGDKLYGLFRGDVDLNKFGYINAYGEIDLKTGKTNIFEALKMKKNNEILQGIGFTDKEIRYIKLNMSWDYKDKFYRLDLSRGYDQ